MRKSAILAMTWLAGSAGAQQIVSDEPFWTPDAAMIARLEAGLKMVGGAQLTAEQLVRYDRYYTGVTRYGRRVLLGKLIVPPNHEDGPRTGIHITDMRYMPQLSGGGCANVSVTYYVDRDQGFGQCSMADVNLPPSEQPHWKPDEQLAARMEVTIREYLHRVARGADLDRYSRYYWGVTIDGKQMVRGRVLMLSTRGDTTGILAPGVHLATGDSGPMLFDGFCNNISLAYDVNGAKFEHLRCDGLVELKPAAPVKPVAPAG